MKLKMLEWTFKYSNVVLAYCQTGKCWTHAVNTTLVRRCFDDTRFYDPTTIYKLPWKEFINKGLITLNLEPNKGQQLTVTLEMRYGFARAMIVISLLLLWAIA